jgi:YhcH/YjgK/YiaL family protein
MLIDRLENAGTWALADEALAFALRWLQSPESAQLAPGTYELRGRDLFAIVAEYETRHPEACRLETHRRYIDVQYVARGRELMGYAPVAALEPDGPYDEARDVQFHQGYADFVLLREGMFAVMLPEDAHMPGVAAAGDQGRVKKIVVKAAVKL